MADQIFRKKVMDRLSSPEQLNDYLRVTSPSMWTVLGVIVLLLVGSLVWASTTGIESQVTGTAQVKNGVITVTLENDGFSKNVREGQYVVIGETQNKITGIGKDSGDNIIATAHTDLPDGEYNATITYRQTQVIELMFN